MNSVNQFGRRVATDDVQRRNRRFIHTGRSKPARDQPNDFSAVNTIALKAGSLTCIHEELHPN
ncbi:hypothetical protein SAMN05444064_118111 [Pseudomonas syringae]|uniref:hypothetical protein n=1 Tax=Pseudomonas syringae TaxID=317 RepID=UPI00089BA066|nr:hypothetical protein [Pseudomonas syringae]SDX34714.1 hypothetical protein SAMN05444514_118111 [Pseudomonas syringae]SFM48356.1 hypothetical protein SAMN05444064_118111 [Pseudomonas syringae]